MPHRRQPLRSFYKPPPLSAIVHSSDPTGFADGLCLPSSYHSKTWLLDNFQETSNESTSCQLTSCEQNRLTEDIYVQNSCLPRLVQTTCSISKPCERSSCQSESSSRVLQNTSQPRQSGSRQQLSLVAQRRQPVIYMTTHCSEKSSVSQTCQTLEYESSQCQSQLCESSSFSSVVSAASGPQVLESSSTYEPACCVTGGLQLPSK
ncbi:keratin-associated protein 27-1 [Ctenodactylus gundi]